MDITVTKVDVEETKFGVKKVLYAKDGNKYRVGSKQRFYDEVRGPGIYSITMGEYNGKPFVKNLEFKMAAPGELSASANVSMAGNKQGQSFEEKMLMDKRKQDDIRLEFYTGIAKDIAIANKKEGEDIDISAVQIMAKNMVITHLKMLPIIDAAIRNEKMKAEDVQAAASSATIDIENQNDFQLPDGVDDPPF